MARRRFNRNQPRDRRGRWSRVGSSRSGSSRRSSRSRSSARAQARKKQNAMLLGQVVGTAAFAGLALAGHKQGIGIRGVRSAAPIYVKSQRIDGQLSLGRGLGYSARYK